MLKILALLAALALLLLQVDLDGAPLVAGWHGLLLVVGLILVVIGIEVGEIFTRSGSGSVS